MTRDEGNLTRLESDYNWEKITFDDFKSRIEENFENTKTDKAKFYTLSVVQTGNRPNDLYDAEFTKECTVLSQQKGEYSVKSLSKKENDELIKHMEESNIRLTEKYDRYHLSFTNLRFCQQDNLNREINGVRLRGIYDIDVIEYSFFSSALYLMDDYEDTNDQDERPSYYLDKNSEGQYLREILKNETTGVVQETILDLNRPYAIGVKAVSLTNPRLPGTFIRVKTRVEATKSFQLPNGVSIYDIFDDLMERFN